MSKERELLIEASADVVGMGNFGLMAKIHEELEKPGIQPLTDEIMAEELLRYEFLPDLICGFKAGVEFAEKHHEITK
jgi:hypothetical protein